MKSHKQDMKLAAEIDLIIDRLGKASSQLRSLDDTALRINVDLDPVAGTKTLSTAKALHFLWNSRALFFDRSLMADPGWSILLSLKISELVHQKTSISALCVDSGVPNTTALRWISLMQKKDLLVRENDPLDARRIFVRLSDEASALMNKYLANASQYLGL